MEHLDRLSKGYGRTTEAQTQARALLGELAELTVEDMFDEGLHEFLGRFVRDIARLGGQVRECYLSGDVR